MGPKMENLKTTGRKKRESKKKDRLKYLHLSLRYEPLEENVDWAQPLLSQKQE